MMWLQRALRERRRRGLLLLLLLLLFVMEGVVNVERHAVVVDGVEMDGEELG
jgi:hypothetical protein